MEARNGAVREIRFEMNCTKPESADMQVIALNQLYLRAYAAH